MDTQSQVEVLRLHCEHLRALIDEVIIEITTIGRAFATKGNPSSASMATQLNALEKQSEHAVALRLQGESLSQPAPELDPLPIPSAQALKDKTEGAITTSLVCHMEEAIARSRKLLQETETLGQERRTARKSQAELPASPLRKRAS